MNTKGSKHLNLQYRNFIEQELNKNSTKTAIAKFVGMDKSSICKEIKKHSYEVKFSRHGVSTLGTYDCQNISSCGFAGMSVLIAFLFPVKSVTRRKVFVMAVI